MSHSPPTVYGIDVGKEWLHISTPVGDVPKKFPVNRVDLKMPNWYDHLKLASPCIIAFEPTGVHYLKPIVIACSYLGIEAEFWTVNNHVTANIREAFISKAKTDDLDARALAFIADMIGRNDPPIGARPYNLHEDEIIYSLRLLINERERIVKERTRALNRLDQLAHGIFPICAIKKETYLKCAQHGYITPADIHELANAPASRPKSIHGNAMNSIRELAQYLPAQITMTPITRAIIADMCQLIENLDIKVAQYDTGITDMLNTYFYQIAQLWRTVPYNGDIKIASYIVGCGGIFESAKQFQRALGVAPISVSSGIKKTNLRPRGYKYAKRNIHMHALAMTSSEKPNVIKIYFGGGKKEGGNSLASCKRKLAGILYAIVKNNQPYQETVS